MAEHEAAAYEGKIIVSEQDGYRLRRVWHDGEWWHAVADVVGAIAETRGKDATAYWRKLKQRLKVKEGAEQVVTSCHDLKMPADDGKNYKTDCAPNRVLFRIIESMPVPRAEPIKQFLAEVGAERLEEIAQPAKAVDRAIQTYRSKGRDDDWIDGRLQNISARNEMTDEWQRRGVPRVEMGNLTAEMSVEMLGVTPTRHKEMKKLGERDALRDHMDRLELAVTTLGEQAAKTMIVANDTKGYAPTAAASMTGAKIAGDAARRIEDEIKRPIANDSNYLPKPVETTELPSPPRGKKAK